ncbi:2-amino-4-hydroxy-6-hydroxymethyldihydropteridine diphosphokinase [Mesotoga sp.]|uniref:2-amino-4-hydroxy-6- hydroxymethyldihydropteridine diphosphokinase n=1 Tax=Mesotoga sp. TaxID=2053577 RepID=UPI001BD5A964|nr:2-amino-4-hydroxy-6-hydroxymethyldihydropteridine diphosphokinase [Mesotoga sp.]
MESDLFLAFGSNIDNRLNYIAEAFTKLIELGLPLLEVSSVYTTQPYGNTEQDDFLNCVGKFRYSGDVRLLIRDIKFIENAVGRVQRFRWSPREIDIDILLHGKTVLQTVELTVPHSDIINRKFVLVPLLEIDRELKDPRDGTHFSDHLERLGQANWPKPFLKARRFRELIDREVKK